MDPAERTASPSAHPMQPAPVPPAASARFPRVELSDRYFLEAYFGWTLEARAATWKLLRRRTYGLCRRLLLSDGATHEELERAIGASPSPRALVSTVWNDFSEVDPGHAVRLAGRRFASVRREASEARWFGVGTYVFDVSQDDETLLSLAQPRVRSKVRSTRRAGYRSEFVERPSPADLVAFSSRYGAMAHERGLAPLAEDALARMFENQDAALARALDPDGVARSWNVVYLTSSHGYYLHGVHDPHASEAGGHQLHMDTLSYVRSRGRRYYDFGLVGTLDPQHGIHRFKRSFGGVFLPSGVERTSSPPGLQRAMSLLRRLRDRARR